MTSPVRIPGEWKIPYNYTVGTFATAFFDGLREGRIIGCRCSTCDRVAVPPKSFCEYCFIPIETLEQVGRNGVVEAMTVVTAPFAGSPPVPYAVVYVRLEGATSAIANYVRGVDLGDGTAPPAAIAIEAPVHAVFAAEPEGRVTDFWFEPGHE
ncbi:Zn-ribbon domain-containing OB-fold protein [Pseudonocardia sp. GCM10023141]|uniref:Zn-ribbon domain-containing OB-fold protein n=1 Tax=Pseudonocardia sp. GCM10023141 TaxID=3252653 RepID=UPI00360F2CB6